MGSEPKVLLARIAVAAAGTFVAVLLFVPIFPAPKGDEGRVGGASAISNIISGRKGWDTEGYYSELVALPDVGEIKPGQTFSGKKAQAIFGTEEQYAGLSSPWDREPVKVAKTGSGSGSGSGSKPDDKAKKKAGYTRADVVRYQVTGVSKSGDRATVSGYAVMRDGNTVSGRVYLQKVDGKWKVVGYGVG